LREFLADRVTLPALELVGELATLVPALCPDDDIALLALSAD
jgi:phosphoserine phosphatase RsbU/P